MSVNIFSAIEFLHCPHGSRLPYWHCASTIGQREHLNIFKVNQEASNPVPQTESALLKKVAGWRTC